MFRYILGIIAFVAFVGAASSTSLIGLTYNFVGMSPFDKLKISSLTIDTNGYNVTSPVHVITLPSEVSETNLCGMGMKTLYFSLGDSIVYDVMKGKHTAANWDRVFSIYNSEAILATDSNVMKLVNLDNGDEYTIPTLDSRWPIVFDDAFIIGRRSDKWVVITRDTPTTASSCIPSDYTPQSMWYNGTHHIILLSMEDGYAVMISDNLRTECDITQINSPPSVITTSVLITEGGDHIVAGASDGVYIITFDGYCTKRLNNVVSCLRVMQ